MRLCLISFATQRRHTSPSDQERSRRIRAGTTECETSSSCNNPPAVKAEGKVKGKSKKVATFSLLPLEKPAFSS